MEIRAIGHLVKTKPIQSVRQGRKANTFDFLGFTHLCGHSRKGKFLLGRKTSCVKFRNACKGMND
jgi:hypothetical protein